MKAKFKKRVNKAAHTTGSNFLDQFINRHHDLGEHHDEFMLRNRLALSTLEAGQATAELWIDLANIVNVAGLQADARQRDDWMQELNAMALALRSIEARHKEEGGMYRATEDEFKDIMFGVNCIDTEIMPDMTATEWNRHSFKVRELFAAEMERREKAEKEEKK